MGINMTNSWGQVTDNTKQLAEMVNQRTYDKIYESFDRVGDWTATNGTIVEESTIVRNGKSIKVTTDSGATCTVDRCIFKCIGTAPVIQFYVYVVDRTTISSIGVFIGSSLDLSKSFSKSPTTFYNGWNLITIYPTDWYNNSSEAWTNHMISLRIRVVANSGKVAVVYLDDFKINENGTPRCVITFDDGRISQYSKAFAYMQTKGVKGTIYAIHGRTGTAGYCTEANFGEIYDAVWDIGNHTYTHENTAGGTYANWVTELSQNRIWLDSLGFTRASRHVAYPGGAHNADTIQAMEDTGMLTGRTVLDSLQFTDLKTYSDTRDAYELSTVYVLSNVAVATVTGQIDKAIQSGKTAILCFHAIEDISTVDIEYPTADFQTIIDYIVASRIPIVTISEWWNELSELYFKKV
jgi:peptidoglycan/xylan/chitin deacetylase (PgdA/CDA1 family)